MRNKIIYELKLNSTDSIRAYENSDYDTCYEDSMLYINIDGKETKIVESSFCYGYGAEMYYRIYNIKDFSEISIFTELLIDDFNSQTYDDDDFTRQTNNIYKNSYFVNGSSSNHIVLFLFKKNDEYTMLYVELWEIETTGKYCVKILKEFKISESMLAEWKMLICTEWEKRSIIEGEKISGKKQSIEEWEKYFQFMRSDNNK